MDFENKEVKPGVRYSHFIAAWTTACRKARMPARFTNTDRSSGFEKWLRFWDLTEEEIAEVVHLAMNPGDKVPVWDAEAYISTHPNDM